MNSYDYLFKFILIGDTGVGKSCLLMRFLDDRFRDDHDATIGVEFGSKIIEIDKYTLKLQIWDTAGAESFRSITRSYYKGAVGAIVTFDITNKLSFENTTKWIQDVSEQGKPDMIRMIVGNKSDEGNQYINDFILLSRRKVTEIEGNQFAQEYNCEYEEVSAKTGQNVNEMFAQMAKKILDKILSNEINISSESSGVKIGNKSQNTKKLNEKNFENSDIEEGLISGNTMNSNGKRNKNKEIHLGNEHSSNSDGQEQQTYCRC